MKKVSIAFTFHGRDSAWESCAALSDGRLALSRDGLRHYGFKPKDERKPTALTGSGCYAKYWWALDDAMPMPSQKGAERREKRGAALLFNASHARERVEMRKEKSDHAIK